ncbi:MAG: 2-oxo acid dehydrogenase subunit E2 [Candidatus Thermoplasmatota archaeon]|nr:2-oxo acid dehydrogenase subunit E2 [Candidatus Thermoplasmatota archaeon]
MFQFRFPDIGEGLTEGEIVKWHVKKGDSIGRDQDMVEVMTDKVTTKIPSPVAGKIASIKIEEGKVAKVGEVLVEIDDGSPEITTNLESKPEETVQEVETHDVETPRGRISERKVLASPAIRKAAREMGVNIEDIVPSGPGGRVTMEDLDAAKSKPKKQSTPETSGAKKESPKPLDEGDEVYEPKGLRRIIFDKMAKSKSIIPHFTILEKVDLSELKDTREELKKKNQDITYTPFFIKACTIALKEFPRFNAIYDEANRRYILKKHYNIGMAVDTPDGLTVAVIKNADTMTVAELAKVTRDLGERARKGELKLSEVQDSTFTVSNVGTIGGISSSPIINYPEVAITSFHRMEKVIESKVQHYIMNISMSCDHRLIDGADAARFISRLKELLEKPSLLLV